MNGKFRINKDAQHPDRPWRVEGKAGGKRLRFYFTNREDAEEKARLENLQLRNFGQAAAALDATSRIDALAACQILAPLGVSLLEAAKFYAAQHDTRAKSVTLAQAYEQYKAHMEARLKSGTLRERHLATIKTLISDFVESCPNQPICDITSQQIRQWLHALPYAPGSKLAYRVNISGLFSHALKCGWIRVHPIKNGGVDVKEFKERRPKRPDILSVEQVARLLEVADPDLVPVIAIGAFAGLRPSEVHLLEWKHIHWDNAEIDVDPEVSKTATYRYVPMSANLLEWLAPYRQASGRIYKGHIATMITRISTAGRLAGIAKWPKDGLRHSYGSYEYARTNSADDTAAQMGNSIEVLFKHYRNRVREEQAIAYFDIRPVQEKIVEIAA